MVDNDNSSHNREKSDFAYKSHRQEATKTNYSKQGASHRSN